MAEAELSTVDGPPRKRESWSLKTIVENVAGKSIDEFQDPSRPVHPYIAHRLSRLPPAAPRSVASPRAADPDAPTDPVDRVIPPLSGATARGLHGAEFEHHGPTLASVEGTPEPLDPGTRPHAPGPSRRPERVYLHYLLLHMDRLSDASLRYLKAAVDEEVDHRATGTVAVPRAARAPPMPDSTP